MTNIESIQQYDEVYAHSIREPEEFWATLAKNFFWRKPWKTVLEWNFEEPSVKWFLEGKLNITENCLDRHLENLGNHTAIIWEPNHPSAPTRHITYFELHNQVCRAANMLRSVGIQKGDRVCIYMPMIPELAIATLACARIGAIHTIVFAGFSAGSLADRVNDAGAKLMITADGVVRGGKQVDLKVICDQALSNCPAVTTCIVFEHVKSEPAMMAGRDVWWHQIFDEAISVCEAQAMDAEDELFILYTSGSTGKPKGMVHTIGGYMVQVAYTFQTVFNYKHGQVFWCTADFGWITGHSYGLYAPLLQGATTVMFEGTPSWPDASRFWQVIQRHSVNIFYTAPTVIRSLEQASISFIEPYDLSSLHVIGTVGEPINEEAWHWYDHHVGKERCPIVDTWWQTETGGFMIAPIAHITPLKPAFATLPLPGVQPIIMDENGREIYDQETSGRLCIKFPWPGMARTIYGDHQRFKQTYFTTFPNKYFTGDGCKRDSDGYYRITGRIDDIIIVSGHNMGTAEIESAIDEHPLVVESAVVGFPHPIKGQGIYAFVICHPDEKISESSVQEIRAEVSRIIGPIAKPDKIQFVTGLPKTRSGKIMRRILRKIAEGEKENFGDVTTLLNPEVVQQISQGAL